jgi:hypothetical protein
VATAPVPIQARATTQIATSDGDGNGDLTGVLESRARPLPAGITLDARGARPVPLLPRHRLVLPVLAAGPLLALLTALAAPFAALAAISRPPPSRRRDAACARPQAAHRQSGGAPRNPCAVIWLNAAMWPARADAVRRGRTAETARLSGSVAHACAPCWRSLTKPPTGPMPTHRPPPSSATSHATARYRRALSEKLRVITNSE